MDEFCERGGNEEDQGCFPEEVLLSTEELTLFLSQTKLCHEAKAGQVSTSPERALPDLGGTERWTSLLTYHPLAS